MSMLPHENFIQVYPNVLGSNLCQALIDLLESSPDSQMRVDNHERPNFSQITLQRMEKGKVFFRPSYAKL